MAWMVWDYPGYADGPAEPRCPVCGRTCDMVYLDRHLEIFACDACVTICDAETEEECFPG